MCCGNKTGLGHRIRPSDLFARPEANEAMAQETGHPAGNNDTRLEDAYRTVKRRDHENDRLRQMLAEQQSRFDELHRALHLAREEASIAIAMVKILAADSAPKL